MVFVYYIEVVVGLRIEGEAYVFRGEVAFGVCVVACHVDVPLTKSCGVLGGVIECDSVVEHEGVVLWEVVKSLQLFGSAPFLSYLLAFEQAQSFVCRFGEDYLVAHL